MQNPEMILLGINILIICVAYFLIYPKFCGSNGHKVAINDLLASIAALTAAGSLFWGSGQRFSLLFLSLNWFWFTLLTYAVIEIPFMLWYFKKYDVWKSFDQ